MRPLKALYIYLANYRDRQGGDFDLMTVFQQIRGKFGGARVLYPGSYLHITPSLVFPMVCFVDSLKGIEEALAAPSLLEYVNRYKGYRENPIVRPYQQDYEVFDAEPEESFDLLVSLNAGLISQACKRFLRPGGLLLVNDEHYDARRAHIDPDYRLIGGFEGENLRLETSEDKLSAYFESAKGIGLTPEMVEADLGRPPSRARFKPVKPAEAYLYQKGIA